MGLFASPTGHSISYEHYPSQTNLHAPTIIFLHGFASDKRGEKVSYLQQQCHAQDIGFLCFDNIGHGESSGSLDTCTISEWSDTCHALIEAHVPGPVILVGSSMGGHLMLCEALRDPARIVGLVGIAAAPDFHVAIESRLSGPQRESLEKTGRTLYHPSWASAPFALSRAFFEDGAQHTLLDKPSIPVHCPIRLLHGMADDVVPYQRSMAIMEQVESLDVSVHLIKGADHRLSRPQDLQLLWRETYGLWHKISGFSTSNLLAF